MGVPPIDNVPPLIVVGPIYVLALLSSVSPPVAALLRLNPPDPATIPENVDVEASLKPTPIVSVLGP